MKKHILAIALIAASLISNAQSNWSFGLRTGVELTKQSYYSETIRPLFSNQLFLSKRIVKNLEAEINCSYSSSINYYDSGIVYDSYEYASQSISTNYLVMGITARYFILKTKTVAPYLLFGVNSITSYTNVSYFNLEQYTRRPLEGEYKSNQTTLLGLYSIGIGVNKEIANHWKLNAQVMINYDNQGFIFSYSSSVIPKLQLGIAYCL